MDLIRVGICLDDVRFAHALSIGLARVCRSMTFTLMMETDAWDDYDLILTAEPFDDPRVIRMVRDEEEVNVYDGPPYRVYRYKESQHLINDLLFIYFRLSGKILEFIGDIRCKILVFASISGGNGCTMTAISAGQMLYKLYGCKCLYLNLCPIDDSKRYLPAEPSDSLLHLLYYLEVERDFPLKSFIKQTDLIDYIHTNVVNSYFDELNFTLLQRLLKKIDELGTYPFLLIDMSNHLSRNNKQILAQASQVILLYQAGDLISPSYFSYFLEELKAMTKTVPLMLVKTLAEDFDAEEPLTPVLSRLTETLVTRDDGTIDLSTLAHFQRETGLLVEKIMEETASGGDCS